MALRRGSVTRSQVILLASYVGTIALTLGITAVLGRSVTPDAFGFFALIGTTFTAARMVLDSGTNSIAVREISGDPGRERPLLEGLMAWRRLLGSAMAVVVAGAALAEDDGVRRGVLLGVAAVLALQAPGALYPAFQIRQAQEGPVLNWTLGLGFILAGSVVLGVLGADGPLYSWLVVFRELLAVVVFGILGRRILGYRPRAGFRGRNLRAFAVMSLVNGLATLCYAVSFHVDVFLVRWLRGESELGAYAAAFRPVNPLLMLPGVLLLPALPALAASAAADRARYQDQVRDLGAVFAGVGAVGAAAGFVLAPDLIAVLYGGRYLHGPFEAVSALRWMCLAFGLVFATQPFLTAILVARGERILLALGIAALGVNVTANLVLLPAFGFSAAAAVTAATAGVVGLGALLAFRRIEGRFPFRFSLAGSLLPAAVVAGILSVIDASPAVRVISGVVLGALGAAALLATAHGRRLQAELGR